MNIPFISQTILDVLRPADPAAGAAAQDLSEVLFQYQQMPRSLEQILALNPRLPAQTAILGICDDGYPVLFDLMDERPGALLVMGATGSGKTRLLKMIVKSAVSLNSPYEVKYSLITSQPEEWADLNQTGGHCHSAAADYEDAAGENIIRLAETASARKTGRQEGAAILLVVDDLRFIITADSDVRLNFEWLLKNGPASGIWPVVALAEHNALDMPRIISQFHTRIIGRMPAASSKRLALFDGLDTENLETGKQFAVRVQNDWLNFWLPSRI